MTLLIAGLLALASAQAPSVQYRVEVDHALENLRVRTCLAVPVDGVEFVRLRERGVDAIRDEVRAGRCFSYRVVIDALLAGRRDEDWGRGGDAIALAPASWLLRPKGINDGHVELVVPPGISLSVPWLRDGTGYRLGASSPRWPTLFAIGRFPQRTIANLRVAFLGELSKVDVLATFVEGTANDVLQTFPHAFDAQPQVVLMATSRGRGDAIPFGQSYRGGGNALVLYVDPTRTLDDYFDEWTATHELVHLVHPYLGDDGRWISEGIATYYQNVLRARGGRITARQAWDNLLAGLERGRRASSGATLGETSRQGRNYMRVYWSGTSLALSADVGWRTRTARPTSLDAVLNAYIARFDRAEPRVDPRTFVDRLDAIAGGEPVFGPLYRANVDARAFPEPVEALRALGLADGSASDGPHRLRDAIMSAPNDDPARARSSR